MLNKLLQPTQLKRVIFFLLFDIIISIGTISLSYLLRFNFDIPHNFLDSMFYMMAILIPIKIILFFAFKIYFIAWRYFGLAEYRKIVFAHIISYSIFTVVFLIFSDFFHPFPRSVIAIDMFLSLFFIGFIRISKRLYIESISKSPQKRTLIIGANDRALQVIKSAFSGDIAYQPIALISDNRGLVGTYFSELKVYSSSDIEDIIDELDIEAVIIVEKLSQKELDRLFSKLNSLGISDIKIAQILQDDKPKLQDISIEDLLARKPQDLDTKAIADFIFGKRVLITGAGGSIGSELSRQVEKFGAKEIILLDHSEFNLYKITEELNGKNIVPIMQSVRDYELLEETFKRYRPQIVLHAAAYKHVPLCEANVKEAILNNIFGTKNVIDLSIKYGVDRFVLVSTDKAVRPTNVMGTTKRICEIYANLVPSKGTDIVAVRFGNVLGSSGSVIPKFKAQIERGEDLTVTHPDITRYFMLIPEACQLVLQAGSIAKGGELFILDMGEPVKIVDLAKKMIELSGRDDIGIKFVGLRAGEKLYEELLISNSDLKTKYSSILVSYNPPSIDFETLNRYLSILKETTDIEILLKTLKKIVPEFNHNRSN
jgi:UDP-N-acetyl-D-glucosamine 4,6-dehydratase